MENRPATDEEINKMAELLAEDLKAGASGFSVGFEYLPQCYSISKEVEALAAVVSKHDKVFTCTFKK